MVRGSCTVFVDLEKAYDRVPREELWYCMRKSGVAEKYVRVVQDMYERSRTVVWCAVGQTEEFKVEVGLHQGSALSPFLFAIVMDQEVRQESPWTMMFADDIVICSESRERVEESLERWRCALERRGMKVSHSKTEYMSVNEREGSGTVRLQGEEVKKVQEFKYLGSTVQSNGESGKEVKKRVQAVFLYQREDNIWKTVKKIMADEYEEQSDFLLDLFSHVKQYECKTGESVLPALLPVYRSLPADWFNVFESKQEEKEPEERWRTFLLDLCLKTALNQPQNIQQTVEKVMIYYDEEQSDFLMDLFSHVKQYESNTGESVLPALLPVYRSLPAVRLDVFDLIQEEKKQRWRTFLLDLCLQTALHQPQYIQQTVEQLMPDIEDYYDEYDDEEQSDFLLDLFSHVKQYESNTGRSVLKALLPVYRSLPAVWSIKLSERKVSLLLEVLKLQTQKKPVELRDWSDEESEVRSFLQCLPYISQLRFNVNYYQKQNPAEFLMSLLHHTTESDQHTGGKSLELLASLCNHTSFPYGERDTWDNSDFLLDLFSHVKQYESNTGRSVLPALLPVYRSLPAVWSIKLSERKVSLLLEVLKLQTQKKPVELIDWSDEESEVRSFLQCLPYISQLRFDVFYSVSASMQCLVNLIIAAGDCQSDKGESFTELLTSVCNYNTFPFGEESEEFHEEQSDFLLDLFTHVKQYEKVLKLQTQKKPVELRDCSDEESEVRSFLQCLPYISQLSFKVFYSDSASRQFLVNLIIAAGDCQSDKGESFTELLTSVCNYNTFPFGETFEEFHEDQSDFLLDLFSHVKQYESNTGRSVLPALLPVYRSLPAVWSIKLSERKVSLLLEVLKLQTQKKPVELRDCSDEESEVRSFLQCLPYISQLRFDLQVGCELEEKERFWSELDEVMESIPTGERVVIGADFNGHVGEGNTGDEEVMGKFGVKERNLEGQMVVDFAKRMDMAVVNTYFQKREEHRVTYKSGGRRTQIEKKTKWWKLKKEECSEVIRETGRKVLGVSSGRRKEDKETRWWNEEVQDSIQRKRLAKKKWDMDRTEENRQEYKELQRRVKREVSKAKQKAYEELYTRLDTREGEKDLYRLARQRDRDGKDVQQVRVIKDRDGRVLTSEESVQRRWKEYFEELMNEENEREKRVEGVNSVEQKVDKIRKDEVRKALKRMKSGKAVGPDDIPVEVWKCLGEAAVEFLANLFNRVLESERMPEEWRSVLVPIFKNKDLEKAYDRVPREELWYCMRKSGVAEKYVRVVQDMYERSRTVVRCAVGQTEEFNVEVGLHQGSALSPFLFAIVMDQLSEEVRQESPWTMMFADDIVICSESREQVEENLERWMFALERRGMKVSR
ncbi:hypothetical protein QTP86_018096, partial [Hemibagrus guttatus]